MYENPVTIKNCSHIFCLACLEQIPKPTTCPKCRVEFTPKDLIKNFDLANSIEKIIKVAGSMPELKGKDYDPLELVLHLSAPSDMDLPPKEKPVRHIIPQEDPENGIWSIEVVKRELTLSDLCEEFPETERKFLKFLLKETKASEEKHTDKFIFTRNGTFAAFISGHRNPANLKEFIIDEFYGTRELKDGEYLMQFIHFIRAFKDLVQIDLLLNEFSPPRDVEYDELFIACKMSNAEFSVKYVRYTEIEDYKSQFIYYIITIDPFKEFSDKGIPSLAPEIRNFNFDFECFCTCCDQMPFDLVFALFNKHTQHIYDRKNKIHRLDEIIRKHPQLKSASHGQIITLLDVCESSETQRVLIRIMTKRVQSNRLNVESLLSTDFRILLLRTICSMNIDFCVSLMKSTQFTGCRDSATLDMYLEASATSGNYQAFRHFYDLEYFKNLNEKSLIKLLSWIDGNPKAIDEKWGIVASLLRNRISDLQFARQEREKEYEIQLRASFAQILQKKQPVEEKKEVVSWCEII